MMSEEEEEEEREEAEKLTKEVVYITRQDMVLRHCLGLVQKKRKNFRCHLCEQYERKEKAVKKNCGCLFHNRCLYKYYIRKYIFQEFECPCILSPFQCSRHSDKGKEKEEEEDVDEEEEGKEFDLDEGKAERNQRVEFAEMQAAFQKQMEEMKRKEEKVAQSISVLQDLALNLQPVTRLAILTYANCFHMLGRDSDVQDLQNVDLQSHTLNNPYKGFVLNQSVGRLREILETYLTDFTSILRRAGFVANVGRGKRSKAIGRTFPVESFRALLSKRIVLGNGSNGTRVYLGVLNNCRVVAIKRILKKQDMELALGDGGGDGADGHWGGGAGLGAGVVYAPSSSSFAVAVSPIMPYEVQIVEKCIRTNMIQYYPFVEEREDYVDIPMEFCPGNLVDCVGFMYDKTDRSKEEKEEATHLREVQSSQLQKATGKKVLKNEAQKDFSEIPSFYYPSPSSVLSPSLLLSSSSSYPSPSSTRFRYVNPNLYHQIPNIYPTPQPVKTLLQQIASGIRDLHHYNRNDTGRKGEKKANARTSIVHMNVNPSNILVCVEGVPKISGMGTSAEISDDDSEEGSSASVTARRKDREDEKRTMCLSDPTIPTSSCMECQAPEILLRRFCRRRERDTESGGSKQGLKEEMERELEDERKLSRFMFDIDFEKHRKERTGSIRKQSSVRVRDDEDLKITKAVDVFALGCLFYYVLVGDEKSYRSPFRGMKIVDFRVQGREITQGKGQASAAALMPVPPRLPSSSGDSLSSTSSSSSSSSSPLSFSFPPSLSALELLGCPNQRTLATLLGNGHPFGGSEIERVMNVLHDRHTLFLVEDEEARHLLFGMLHPKWQRRLSIEKVLSHPFMWSIQVRLDFLVKVSDYLNTHSLMSATFDESSSDYTDGRDEIGEGEGSDRCGADSSSSSSSSSSSCSSTTTTAAAANTAIKASPSATATTAVTPLPLSYSLHPYRVSGHSLLNDNWRKWVDQRLIEISEGYRHQAYDGTSLTHLLRFIRNMSHHYGELTTNLQSVLGLQPDGFLNYFEKRFPKLLIYVWIIVERADLQNELK